MKQYTYGLLLFIILMLPPVSNLMESIMIVHMHMQMPLLVFAGFLMARYVQIRFPNFFEKWNSNGVPGIILFIIISVYWMLPRAMDEALNSQSVQLFKFFSLPFLAGIPLRDSWNKLSSMGKSLIFVSYTIIFVGMGWLYIYSPVQLCNNYLLIEQITLGWGFITMALCMLIYMLYITFMDSSQYE